MMYYYPLLLAVLVLVVPSHINAVNTAPFNINDEYTAFQLAYASYCNQGLISNWACTYCTSNTSATSTFSYRGAVSNSGAGLYVYYGYRSSSKTLYVVFRGSTDIENWITNLDAISVNYSPPNGNLPSQYSGAWVHQGFWDAFEILQPVLGENVLSSVSSTGATKVVFVGHSLGGALATFAALEIGPTLPVTYGAYTFGSPRVGNSAFVGYYQSVVPSTFRVTNQADIVPHILIEDAGWQHVAQEIWYDTATQYKSTLSTTNGEDSNGSDSLWITISVSDHLSYLNTELNSC